MARAIEAGFSRSELQQIDRTPLAMAFGAEQLSFPSAAPVWPAGVRLVRSVVADLHS